MAVIGGCMLLLAWLALRARSAAGAVAVLVAVVCAGLAYDNLAVAAGRLIGYGDALRAVNAPRFWIHALLTPLLVLAGVALAARLGVRRAAGRAAAVTAGALALLLIVAGAVFDIVALRLEPESYADAQRYVNADAAGPPIPAIVTILVLIALGAAVWRTAGSPWLCLGAVAMFAAAAVGASHLWVGNLGELVLQAAVVATLLSPPPAPVSGSTT